MPLGPQCACNPRGCLEFDPMTLIVINRERKQPLSGFTR